ncbi:MAG TPA: RICIN domain-containing protein [Methylococcaceae bacterium]|jgi:hypothetical protein|nr:RICIN domain-containing protein [Methylococcaceae bacterium]
MKHDLIAFMLAGAFVVTGCGGGDYKYTIVSQHSAKCVGLPVGGGYFAGDPVEQWDCSHYHMGLQGSWLIEPVGPPNTYQVVSIHSGMCLEVNASLGGGKNNGDPLRQTECTGADNQKWLVVTDSAGISTFESVHSGKCMEVRLGTTGGKQDGDVIEQWDCLAGAKHQTWKLGEIAAPNPPLDAGKGGLCNVCNPANTNCNAGAMCLVLTSGQTVCGQSCSTAVGCPKGYTCTQMTQLGKTYFQCVPDGNSCPR